MPVVNGVGQSEYSPTKEEHYSKILGWHMNVAARVIKKGWNSDYLFIDATAGSGKLYDCGGIDGSPLVFLRQAAAHLAGVKWRSVMCEQKPESFDLLAQNMRGAPGVTLYNARYQDVLRRFGNRGQIGLLYMDENGTPDFDALCDFANRNRSMEILISVTGTGVKRGKMTDLHLHEWIERIPKKHWAMRKPYTQWQWTFLFGSNYDGFAKEYRSIDMVPLDSETGKQYMETATYTKGEISKKVQPPLLTEPMLNI